MKVRENLFLIIPFLFILLLAIFWWCKINRPFLPDKVGKDSSSSKIISDNNDLKQQDIERIKVPADEKLPKIFYQYEEGDHYKYKLN
ncbi:hypothetical protein ACFL23_04465 [Patescibacteria group bacterium]